MKINLETAVNRLFPNHSLDMVYIEAIANSLDAKATEIEMSLNYKDGIFSEFKIKDNGIGLNERRYFKFSNLMETEDSSHKGQGRLVFLHYFDQVLFESKYEDKDKENKKIRFEFSYKFKEEECSISKNEDSKTGTTIFFKGFSKERVKRKKDLSATKIKEKIISEFLPCFQKIKEDKKKHFSIKINSIIDDEITRESISEKSIPEFKSIPIEKELLEKISNKLSADIARNLFREPLTLYFDIKNSQNKSSIVTCFAVDNRTIDVPIIDESNYIENIEAIFFITSKGFDGLTDGTRKELTISNPDLKQIKKIFKEKITIILDDMVPQFSQNKNKQIDFFEEKYPHLHGYLPTKEVGFISKKDILNKARDKFFDDQRKILEKEHLSDDDYQKALELSSRNLTEYIIFRQKQIDKLKEITKEDREKTIHDIISPQKNKDTQENLNIFKNNAWILDDRFMTFSHSFSDVEMSQISKIELFGQKSESKCRPDFLMLFSNPIEKKPEEIDIVIFEFKRLQVDIHQKHKAVTELQKYARDIKDIYDQKTKTGRIWLYALVDIDESFRNTLIDDDFKSRFTASGEVWYKYYQNLNLEISFLDFSSLVSDANTRNRTFIDILKDKFTEKNH